MQVGVTSWAGEALDPVGDNHGPADAFISEGAARLYVSSCVFTCGRCLVDVCRGGGLVFLDFRMGQGDVVSSWN